jgi:prepilin-type N-terminal cleavage/methylation domain-containing protein
MKSREHGYSVAEMLVVIAIIGLLSLAAVPAFMSFQNANKLRTSVRIFTSDLRAARQRAITRSRQVLITYATTANGAAQANYQRTYYFFEGNLPSSSTAWTPVTNTLTGTGTSATVHSLEDIVYFPTAASATPQTFDDTVTCTPGGCSSGADNRPDIIFFPDGHALVPTNATVGQITIKTDAKIAKKQYLVEISPSGNVKVTAQ